MIDIYWGSTIIWLISIAFFLLAQKIAKKLSHMAIDISAVGIVALIWVYSKFLWKSAFLATLLPFSNLIVLGNWFIPFAALLAGFAWRRISGPLWRKSLWILVLMSICCYNAYGQFFKDVPPGQNRWKKGVALQTSLSTCASACAATLLKHYGISSSEQEMIPLCCNSTSGTTVYGLFRGLKLKTKNSKHKVEIFACSLEQLKKMPLPVILVVGLKKGARVDPRYHQRWGWIPGIVHMVVLFDFKKDGRIEMGDPAVGREFWDLDALKVLWHGKGICIR